MGDDWIAKKLERIDLLEKRIAYLKSCILDYSPKEWHYRTGLESLDSLQKTLVLNELMLVLVKNDLPVNFYQSFCEPMELSYKIHGAVVACA